MPEPELWSDETIAEFHLNNAMDEEGYRWAINEVLSMGVDPLQLNPDHLFHDFVWQNPALYVSEGLAKQL